MDNAKKPDLAQEIQTALKADDMKLIDDLAAAATPRQIRSWIARLEDVFASKKDNVRNDLQSKVQDIVDSNGYTLEELFGARILPSADELAELAS